MNYISNPNAPMRDKYWHEKIDSEKVEVLADLLVAACRDIRGISERLDELAQHAHNPTTGAVLVPMIERFNSSRTAPVGYYHEDFMLGRAPKEHYAQGSAIGSGGWPGEAQAAGAMPPPQPAPAPATGPENQPDAEPGLADPDWPKEPPNPQFHPKMEAIEAALEAAKK
jgi:hypothetical protein